MPKASLARTLVGEALKAEEAILNCQRAKQGQKWLCLFFDQDVPLAAYPLEAISP